MCELLLMILYLYLCQATTCIRSSLHLLFGSCDQILQFGFFKFFLTLFSILLCACSVCLKPLSWDHLQPFVHFLLTSIIYSSVNFSIWALFYFSNIFVFPLWIKYAHFSWSQNILHTDCSQIFDDPNNSFLFLLELPIEWTEKRLTKQMIYVSIKFRLSIWA